MAGRAWLRNWQGCSARPLGPCPRGQALENVPLSSRCSRRGEARRVEALGGFPCSTPDLYSTPKPWMLQMDEVADKLNRTLFREEILILSADNVNVQRVLHRSFRAPPAGPVNLYRGLLRAPVVLYSALASLSSVIAMDPRARSGPSRRLFWVKPHCIRARRPRCAINSACSRPLIGQAS